MSCNAKVRTGLSRACPHAASGRDGVLMMMTFSGRRLLIVLGVEVSVSVLAVWKIEKRDPPGEL